MSIFKGKFGKQTSQIKVSKYAGNSFRLPKNKNVNMGVITSGHTSLKLPKTQKFPECNL